MPALLDLTPRMTDPNVVAIWSLSDFDPADLEHRKRVLAFYPPHGTRRLFGFAADGVTLATCGVQRIPPPAITIRQFATHPSQSACAPAAGKYSRNCAKYDRAD